MKAKKIFILLGEDVEGNLGTCFIDATSSLEGMLKLIVIKYNKLHASSIERYKRGRAIKAIVNDRKYQVYKNGPKYTSVIVIRNDERELEYDELLIKEYIIFL